MRRSKHAHILRLEPLAHVEYVGKKPLLINCIIVVRYMTFGQNLLELWFCCVFKVITVFSF